MKAIKRLQQSRRQWNSKLDSKLRIVEIQQCKRDPVVYIMTSRSGTNIIAVYVDDMLIASLSKADM